MNTVKLFAICILGLCAVSLLNGQTVNSSFYNSNGSSAGYSQRMGNTTNYYNANGSSAGSSTTWGTQNNSSQNRNTTFGW